MGRVLLTFDINTDNGMLLGQSTTVEDLSSARRLMDLSSMMNLKAISSVWSRTDVGGVGEGDRMSMLYPAIVSCLTPSLNSGSKSGDFFFQAEDGIRDLTVTGVQTCALPI